MKTLDIRSFVLGIAVVAALAIGTFVALDRTDDTAQAAPQTSELRAVPQGVLDLQFQCMGYGITALMNAGFVGSYTCHSSAGSLACFSDDPGEVSCVNDENDSTCTITPGTEGTEAECTDSDGGSHFCSLQVVLNCENTGGAAGMDYIDCYNDGPIGPLTCGTESGPLVCLVTPDQFLTFVCSVVSSFPSVLWGDLDCDGETSARDNQALLRRVLGNAPLSQMEPCANVGDPISLQPERPY
jgi:hypothetical protein